MRTRPQPEKGQRKGRRKSIDILAVRGEIERQKKLIIKCIKKRDRRRVYELLEQLIDYQTEHGGLRFVVKSLCDLATAAKKSGDTSLQLELTGRCIELQPDDGWSWTQYGG